MIASRAQFGVDPSRGAAGESVLQRIEQQFVGDQAEQNALVEIERYTVGRYIQREFAARGFVRAQQRFRKLAEMRREFLVPAKGPLY